VSRWIHSTKEPAWAALFTSYTKSAYRLEGQQIYSSPSEDATLARFLAGQPLQLDLSRTTSRTHAQVAAGRTKVRVRVVVEPPTEYTRLELVVYPELVAAGEDIRVIAVPDGDWPARLPRHDYWLFDDQQVWRMHYGDDYRFSGAELIEDEDAIAQHLEWRNVALSRAIPLNDYLATHATE
jgi:hypothetical protein